MASTGLGLVSAAAHEPEDAAAEADDEAAEEAADDAAGAWGRPDGPDGPAGTACGLEAAWATTCWAYMSSRTSCASSSGRESWIGCSTMESDGTGFGMSAACDMQSVLNCRCCSCCCRPLFHGVLRKKSRWSMLATLTVNLLACHGVRAMG